MHIIILIGKPSSLAVHEETLTVPNSDPQPKVMDPEKEEDLKKNKALVAIARAKMKGMNKKRLKKSAKVKAKELKLKQNEDALKQQLKEEKQNVMLEQEKTKVQERLYANERAKNSNLKVRVKRLQSEQHNSSIGKKAVKNFVSKTFKGKAQQKMLLNPNQKWAKTDKDDIVEALVIRTLSPKTFEYLRKNGSLYLPSRHTINRHIDGIATCKPG